jgi:hypothetical protein
MELSALLMPQPAELKQQQRALNVVQLLQRMVSRLQLIRLKAQILPPLQTANKTT